MRTFSILYLVFVDTQHDASLYRSLQSYAYSTAHQSSHRSHPTPLCCSLTCPTASLIRCPSDAMVQTEGAVPDETMKHPLHGVIIFNDAPQLTLGHACSSTWVVQELWEAVGVRILVHKGHRVKKPGHRVIHDFFHLFLRPSQLK